MCVLRVRACLRSFRSITIPYFTEKSRPDSFYDKVMENQKTGSHTLVLLDIQVKEQSYENLLK